MKLQVGIESEQAKKETLSEIQAALKSMAKPRRQSGQNTVRRIIRCLKTI